MNRRTVLIIFIVLLLFAGIIALTQELDTVAPENDFEMPEAGDDGENLAINNKEPAKWFKSNAGGLAIKEIKSRIIALRNEYALSMDSAASDELPAYLLPYYNEEYDIEVRTFYKNGAQIRTQWLFRDINGRTRFNAVILETSEEKTVKAAREDEEDRVVVTQKKEGFIEIFDDKSNLAVEYGYLKDGNATRIDFIYNDNLLISAVFYKKQQDENDSKFIKIFADLYGYNRSRALRTIERVFYVDIKADENDLVKISFPRNIRETSGDEFFVNERINLYPDFFGDVYIENNSRIIFDVDNRGRILKQTLFDEENEMIWVITNTWQNNRIVLTTKTQGDLTLTAEFQYNREGERISERNLKNGILERSVKAEGGLEIEELYINNVVVLRAVWEDGRKISETRMR